MTLKVLAEQLWGSHRGSLILLVSLLILNLLVFFTVEIVLAPRVLEKENIFLEKQAEARDILHSRGGSAQTPEQLYALASQDVSRFRQAVPEYQEFTGLIEELLVLANDARLDINQINYASEPIQEGNLLQFSLNFNVVGDYGQVKRFIHSLEQSVRLVIIKQIALQGTDDNRVDLRLSLETFFRPGGRES